MREIIKENVFYKRNLPHIHPKDGIFFVTFRLANSLPIKVVKELKAERDSQIKLLEQKFNQREREKERYNLEKRYFAKFDGWLDKATHGPEWLKEPSIATTITDQVHEFNFKRYQLIAYCIMSNHVHLLIDLRKFNIVSETNIFGSTKHYPLSDTLRLLKGITSRECNKNLGRGGQFWHHESYDHYVRNEEEIHSIEQYIINNPVKAGLVDDWREWQFSYLDTSVSDTFST